jgi:hypothetical protein
MREHVPHMAEGEGMVVKHGGATCFEVLCADIRKRKQGGATMGARCYKALRDRFRCSTDPARTQTASRPSPAAPAEHGAARTDTRGRLVLRKVCGATSL